jgi:hypothetical protein
MRAATSFVPSVRTHSLSLSLSLSLSRLFCLFCFVLFCLRVFMSTFVRRRRAEADQATLLTELSTLALSRARADMLRVRAVATAVSALVESAPRERLLSLLLDSAHAAGTLRGETRFGERVFVCVSARALFFFFLLCFVLFCCFVCYFVLSLSAQRSLAPALVCPCISPRARRYAARLLAGGRAWLRRCPRIAEPRASVARCVCVVAGRQ